MRIQVFLTHHTVNMYEVVSLCVVTCVICVIGGTWILLIKWSKGGLIAGAREKLHSGHPGRTTELLYCRNEGLPGSSEDIW